MTILSALSATACNLLGLGSGDPPKIPFHQRGNSRAVAKEYDPNALMKFPSPGLTVSFYDPTWCLKLELLATLWDLGALIRQKFHVTRGEQFWIQ